MYATDAPYSEATTRARHILTHGVKVFRDCYKYNGSYYWIVNGRLLTKEQAAPLEEERRLEGRTNQHVTKIRTRYGD